MKGRRRLTAIAVAGALLLVLLAGGVPATAGDVFTPPLGVDVSSTSAKEVSFDSGDFAGTTLTVSQTKELGHQGLTVSWKGAPPTPRETLGQNVFAFMQCWGDPAAADPDPRVPGRPDPNWARETCQFGSLLDTPVWSENPAPGGGTIRTVGVNGRPDPEEKKSPAPLPDDAVIVPFRPAKGVRIGSGGASDPYPDNMSSQTGSDVVLARYFDRNKTNEIPYGYTAGDGTGRVVFEAQTATEAPHLGCGRPDSTGVVQPCWLVIVPRGHTDPLTGADLTGADRPVDGSPLTASLWKHHVAVRLDFRSVNTPCSITASERATIGSEMIAPAMAGWQPALCGRTGTVYGYTPSSEDITTGELGSTDESATGLGFTSSPVGGRQGGPPPVHAPVALSAVVVAFTIDNQVNVGALTEDEKRIRAKQVSGMRLTPKLLAKLLTASYQRDVPDGTRADYLKDNYRTVLADPEFRTVNPDFRFSAANRDIQPVLAPIGGSAANRAVWGWILADKAARDFLGGVADPAYTDPVSNVTYHMKVNRFYQGFGLTGPVPDHFPKSDTTCSKAAPDVVPDLQVCIFNKQPYTSSMTAGAQQTLKADSHAEVEFDQVKYENSQHNIAQLKRADPQQQGNRWVMSITDSASAARFGLYSASLFNGTDPADLTQYVAPTTATLQSAVSEMKPTGNPDVLALDPSVKKPTVYPLTMLTYAAVDRSRSPEALQDYANFVEFAAGDGQHQGDALGDLPPGYVPLPDALRAKARSAAVAIRAGWKPAAAAVPATAAPPTPTQQVPARGSVPSLASPPAPSKRASLTPVPVAVARQTEALPVGWTERYLLTMLLGAGILAAATGPVLLGWARRREGR